jgi:hypothetical protein
MQFLNPIDLNRAIPDPIEYKRTIPHQAKGVSTSPLHVGSFYNTQGLLGKLHWNNAFERKQEMSLKKIGHRTV